MKQFIIFFNVLNQSMRRKTDSCIMTEGDNFQKFL